MLGNPFRLLCGLSLLILAGCQTQGAFTQADLDAAEAEIRVELDNFWQAWSATSFDEGMAFYSESPDMQFVTDGVLWESKAAAEEAFRPFFESLDHQEINLSDTRIMALTPEVVYATQTGSFTQFSRTGEVSPERTFATTLLWVKEGGEWKVLGYHESQPNPPTANIRSVHLLNTASPADEAAYAQLLNELNAAVRAAGHFGNGYELWKMSDTQDPEENPIGAGMILEGSWTNQETYDLIHDLEVYQSLDREAIDLFDRVSAGQRYTRYLRIPVGGPGEG